VVSNAQNHAKVRTPITTARQISANRANAAGSTGPRTEAGKAVARLNALRHGLAAAMALEPSADEELEKLARAILPGDNQSELLGLARRVAEAELMLRRVRRAQFMSTSIPFLNAKVVARYSIDDLQDSIIPGRQDPTAPSIVATPEQRNDYEADALVRYERRALSRRKSAIRDFDAARSLHSSPSSRSGL